MPDRGLHYLHLSIDVNLLELVDQDHRWITVDWDIAGGDLHLQPLVRGIPKLLHDRAGLLAILIHVQIVTRERLQDLWRHSPNTFRSRQHGATDCGLTFGEDVDEGLAVEREGHGLAYLRIVERWRLPVYD